MPYDYQMAACQVCFQSVKYALAKIAGYVIVGISNNDSGCIAINYVFLGRAVDFE